MTTFDDLRGATVTQATPTRGVVHQCALLEKRVNALQTAISPLSELYKDYRGDENVIYSFVSDDGKTSQLTFGDIRRAYEVLNEA